MRLVIACKINDLKWHTTHGLTEAKYGGEIWFVHYNVNSDMVKICQMSAAADDDDDDKLW